MKRLGLVVISVIISISCFGQWTIRGNTALNELAELKGNLRTKFPDYEGVRGTPYLHDKWTWGRVLIKSGLSSDSVQIKVNIHEDLLAYKKQNGDSIIIDGMMIDQFMIFDQAGPRYFKNLTVVEQMDNKSDIGFFEVIVNGSYNLLAKHSKYFEAAKNPGAYEAGQTYDEYTSNKPVYYLLEESTNRLWKVKPKLKSLTEILGKESQLKNFAQKNDLNMKEQADLAKLIEYYNSLGAGQ